MPEPSRSGTHRRAVNGIPDPTARARPAPGRWYVPGGRPATRGARPFRALAPRGLVVPLLFLLAWGCGTAESPPPPPRPSAPSVPAIEPGGLPPGDQARAAARLGVARRALEAGEWEAAREAARVVVEEYPRAQGSAEALEILGRAALELGDTTAAREAAERYLRTLPRGHPREGLALLLAGHARLAAGDRAGGVATLLELEGRPEAESALDLVRRSVQELSGAQLQDLVERAPPGPLRAPLLAELALGRFLQGHEEEARNLASRALEEGAGGREAEVARAVLRGDVEGVLGAAPRLGVLLPMTGSPTMQEYARLLLEGVEVAVHEYEARLRRRVAVQVADDGGRASGVPSAVESLLSRNVVGIVGPLLGWELKEVEALDRGEVVVLSPTAATYPLGAGLYSLVGPDPGGPELVARAAVEMGLERVVPVFPEMGAARFEAEAFARAFRRLGGVVPRQVPYDSGATFFQDPLRQVEELLPDGIYLPLPPPDIRIFAPQVTFFGIDTLGIQVLGNDHWTEPEIVEGLESRHTDGVIASTTRPPEGEGEAYRTFVEAYERYHEKTLRSRIPALGYDAAALLLEAVARGARTPAAVRTVLEEIEGFPGATGRISVREGRIVREHYLVRIQGNELIYFSRRFRREGGDGGGIP